MTSTDPQTTVAVTDTPYLIDGHVHLPSHAGVRVAYAVRDQWGWAIHAKRRGRIRTVARVDHRHPGPARVEARRIVERLTAAVDVQFVEAG